MKKMECVMCEEEPERIRDENTGIIYFVYWIAPQTKEILCEKCNSINDNIALEKGDKKRGERIIKKYPKN